MRLFMNSLKPKNAAMVEACAIGLAAGFSAYLLKEGASILSGWRINAASSLSPFIVWPAIGCAGGLAAGWLVEKVAPEATGSGIPQVKALLGRVRVNLGLKVALVKLLGGVIALGTGMPLGREGPTVQVGAGLAAEFSRRTSISPERQRQLIAAGAGAGLAAAFNAPIAGFLFVLEELMQDLSALTVGTAIVACFVASVVARLLGVHSLDIKWSELPKLGSFAVVDIPFYLLLGLLSGLLGALFNRLLIATMRFNARFLPVGMRWRVALAGLSTGIVSAFLPLFFAGGEGSPLRQMLASSQATWQLAAAAFFLQGIVILVDYGSGAPGGLFGPSVALGAALGYVVGYWEHVLVGGSLPSTFALVGMGTFFTAVCRVPMTAIVIVFEMTHNFNIVLQLMFGCVVSHMVAESVWKGSVYDHLLKFQGIVLKRDSPAARALSDVTVRAVMQKTVVSLPVELTLEQALEKFKISRHRGFPVTDEGRLAGIVTQTDLIGTAERSLPPETPLRDIMSVQPVTVSPGDSMADVLRLLDPDQYGLWPVMEDDRLVGVISSTDVLRAIATAMKKQE
jgi:CIC family chloride channel protein